MNTRGLERDNGSVEKMADTTELPPTEDPASSDDETVKGDHEGDHIAEILEEVRHISGTPVAPIGNGTVADRYRQLQEAEADAASETGSTDAIPRRAGSPIDSLLSIPDDSPSVQGSVLSSPSSSVLPSVASRPGLSSPTPSFRPFDRRFQSRISSPSLLSPRPSSPAFLSSHSRRESVSSQLLLDGGDTETPSPPWEVVRWTKLKKLNGQAFSEAGKRNFGTPTCIAVSASIVLGTSKGIILMFDYNQNLKTIIGPGTKAAESGAITSIAISADHTTIAGGHADGSIFTWDTARPSRPFLTIPHLDASQLTNRTVDGHLPNVAVTHLGFLGQRHTALVSADDRGMAFSHLATRGTGALGRSVKTTRILGRYPDSKPLPSGKALKPSTVLAFAPLPLGNVERGTDAVGLTAMLTPYLLVIVSTTPIAQTQHKSARPKDVEAHSAMTGCLAWFPAVKLKVPDPITKSQMSKVKLVYCWSNVLTVLDVDEIPAEDKDKPPSLKFKARSRWKCEEAIVAVQWLSRSVLTVLTISQRLIVIEDRSMRMTEAFDLIHKHIYHKDMFSKQLHSLVEQLDEEDTTMHGVVADAFYMSFKAYKGRLFLMGFNEVSIGALSNWADRLIALMEHGDYVGAIQLATSYYTGDADKLTVGLPEDTELRHSMVQEELMKIMSASLKYAFGRRQKDKSAADDNHLQELAETCFTACQSVGDIDFLFDEMWEWYEDGEVEGIFLETLEPYILEKKITAIPPGVVKAMVSHFVTKGWESRLEEVICHMDTATLDLDQITLLCKQHSLYDALIYVWNQALNDYITPLIDLLNLLLPLMQDGEYRGSSNVMEEEIFGVNALKMFPYLSYAFTGRVYPTGDFLSDSAATKAKAELYWFLFSGDTVEWPKGSKKRFLTKPNLSQQPSFPYLRMILKFDAPSFLSTLNEAFEDSFLNDTPEKQMNGNAGRELPEEQIFGMTINRQHVVSILIEIMNPSDFAPEDTVYLDMFIARNLPKYPQYLLFPGSTLTKVLTGLCNYPGRDLAEDAQLSAEYLLSVYHPPDVSSLIPLFKNAGFYRILKRIYRVEKQYGKLLQTYFEDPEDQDAVFGCIEECLRPKAHLTKRQIQDVHQVIKDNARDLVALDAVRAAQTLAAYAPSLHEHVLDSVADEPEVQYAYLKTILEPEEESGPSPSPQTQLDHELVEQYVQLMCKFRPSHVSDYVSLVYSADLKLDRLLPTMEETGVIDAAVVLMAREGLINEAMERLIKHLGTLESALEGLLTAADSDMDSGDLEEGAEQMLESVQKYIHVGIWLCQDQTRAVKETTSVRRRQKSPTNDALTTEETLWLNLIDTAVQITRRISSQIESLAEKRHLQLEDVNGTAEPDETKQELDADKLLALARTPVQHTFTALLTSTSNPTPTSQAIGPRTLQVPAAAAGVGNNLSFLRILRAFLTRAATTSPTLADLRAVLSSIFSAYAYEESILRLANRLLDRSLFVSVSQSVELRQRGWRPRGSTCEACGRRVWGPGVAGGSGVFEAWEEKNREEERRRAERKGRIAGVAGGAAAAIAAEGSRDKGKGKGTSAAVAGGSAAGGSGSADTAAGNGKGKGKAADMPGEAPAGDAHGGDEEDADESGQATGAGDVARNGAGSQTLGPLVVLACRHIYHQSCLDELLARADGSNGHGAGGDRTVDEFGRARKVYRCPIDG